MARAMGHAWFGSKATSGLCQALVALMPPHAVCIETHLGGGAVMPRKPPALRNIGIDPDCRALSRFECGYPVELVHGDCHAYLSQFAFDGSELVYSDPPYLRSARKSARRYRHDYEDADHERLLELLKGLPCAAMVLAYPSALYDELLGGWRSVSLLVMNQAGVVTEKVWFNFAPDRMHWASCAGRNFTHRQTVKRKAARWGRRYAAMPPAERLAVLATIMAAVATAACCRAGRHRVLPLAQDPLRQLLDPQTQRRCREQYTSGRQ